ncbi:MAG: hypothetical protein BMS9Abin26_2190 [Gammaproteobacteria bacterium]|nr:MAG: hypothetical protein BMS9Abin26_2190 [Gammaproteobacteria bacterium]
MWIYYKKRVLYGHNTNKYPECVRSGSGMNRAKITTAKGVSMKSSRLLRIIAAGMISSIFAFTSLAVSAASTLTLTPSVANAAPGGSFTVDIIADGPATAGDSTDNLVVADVNINFDNAVLQLDGIDTGTGVSAFYHVDTSAATGFPIGTIDNATGTGQTIVATPTPGLDDVGHVVARLSFSVLGGAASGNTNIAVDVPTSNLVINDGNGTDDLTTATDATVAIGPPSPDTDGDGIPDSSDNCINVPNADQRNTNFPIDNFGNICDPDLNNDGAVNFADLGLLKAVFNTADPDADFNGDGAANFGDLGILKSYFNQPPGP